ncbi:MAG: GntR family transcriptional regulator [Jatrophihabitans sp.]
MSPLHTQIAADIRAAIRTGRLDIGDPIPSEAQLAQQWQVSRAPVRQALATLRAEGLIGGGPGKPAVVRGRSLGQPFETFLSFSSWVSGLGLVPGQRTVEIARRRADATIADHLGIEPGDAVVEVLRLRTVDGEPAMVERSCFVDAVGRALFDFDCDSGSIYAFLITRGADLSSARHTIDAVVADPTDAALLGIDPGRPLLRERRLAGPAGGPPSEYSDDRYRPDLVTFTIDNAAASAPALSRHAVPELI